MWTTLGNYNGIKVLSSRYYPVRTRIGRQPFYPYFWNQNLSTFKVNHCVYHAARWRSDLVTEKSPNTITLRKSIRDSHIYWRPGTVCSNFHVLPCSVLTKSPQQRTCCHHHFTDEETEVSERPNYLCKAPLLVSAGVDCSLSLVSKVWQKTCAVDTIFREKRGQDLASMVDLETWN